MSDELSNLLAKFIAGLALLAGSLFIQYIAMTKAWGVELKSLPWFIATALASGVLVALMTALGGSNKS